MPGSGKTTLGKELSLALALPFIDLDRDIEEQIQMTIPDIFRTKGEPFFREMESERLHYWSSGTDGFVMATGGGAPCFFDAMNTMKSIGLVLFLDVPLEELLLRLEKDTHRPLLEDKVGLKEKLNRLMRDRISIYQQAHASIHGAGIQLKDLLQALEFKN